MTIIKNCNPRSSEFTGSPDKYPQKHFKAKPCKNCSCDFDPIAPSHLHCSDKCADNSRENRYFMKNYGISRRDAYDLLDKQGGKCAICESQGFKINEDAKNNLALDHDHETGAVRGFLCHNCNRALGLFKDSVDNLKKAIDYLT